MERVFFLHSYSLSWQFHSWMLFHSVSFTSTKRPLVYDTWLKGGSIHQFTQQSLPACKPVLTPAWVIGTFFLMGVIFIPVGLISLQASQSVLFSCSSYERLSYIHVFLYLVDMAIVSEILDRYDTDCVPDTFKSNKVAYIKNASIPKSCNRDLKVPKHMKAPIYIYYQLDNFYQNHRRYVKSRSDEQLLHGLGYNKTGSCEPQAFENGLPIVPCGLVAWSLFNDTYSFSRGTKKLEVERKNIAWKSDRDHKFGKEVYPFNFQNGSFIGGGKLDMTVPLSDQEDFIVWMRTAAFPSFRKLYGIIEEDLDEDDIIVVKVMNNYNTYSFGGTKMLVLSTSSWLGGRNSFLGVAYIFVGASSILIALIFLLLHVKNPRSQLTIPRPCGIGYVDVAIEFSL
ncbi:putative ALA-interacting subunit 2 isoform X1 [Tanacetum coccineum]